MLQNGAYRIQKLDQFFMESGGLSSRRQGPLNMTGFHRNRRSKRLKTVHLPVSYSIGRMHAALSIFKFANLTLTNPDSQDPKYCGWWFKDLPT
jgi:hypothetical protein